MTFYVYVVARDGPRATSLEVMEFNEAMEITAHQELYDILEEALINEVLAITSGCQDQSQNINTLETSNINHMGRDDQSSMCRDKPEILEMY